MTASRLLPFLAAAGIAAMSAAGLSESAWAQPAGQDASFKAEAERMLRTAFPADGPGAAGIVTRRGKLLYQGVQGLADVANKRPIRPGAAFPLGSLTKQFTAAAILKLVEQRKIALDDPLSRFFPDWPEPSAKATVRQLLNHSSGVQDFTKIPGWIAANRLTPQTTAKLVALTRSLPARAAPGEKWEYNNGGYVLLGAILEQVSGKPWHQAIQETVLAPLQLHTIRPLPGDGPALRVLGYREENGRQVPVPRAHPSIAHAAGGLTGSVSDVAAFANALHHGKVVGSALYSEMTSPARLAEGTTQPYGFGLRLSQLRGRAVLAHGGAGAGLDTDSIYIPSEDLFVAVFANSSNPATDPSLLSRRLAALALGAPFPTLAPVVADLAAPEPLFGTYAFPQGPARTFFARDGKLFMGRGDDQRQVFAAGANRFFFGPRELGWFTITPAADGHHRMEVHAAELAAPMQAVWSGPVPKPVAVDAAVLRSYVGTYQTETVRIVVALSADGRLTAAQEGRAPAELRAVSPTEYGLEGTPMRIVFHAAEGRVDRLTIHRGARELHGKRVGR
jgi:CubicO group peptidase (beta-lactamase class C family)